jgi:hypothetical protein
MAKKKELTEAKTEPEYRILAGFIFNHCIYVRGGIAQFSEKAASDLIKRGLIAPAN